MKKIVTEENSGIALIMQVILIALFSAIVSFVINVNSSKSLIISLLFFILYAIIIHNIFLNNFRKGLRYYRKGEYKDAIIFFQRVYYLFNRHKLLDKLRYFALFSHSKKSYREMSLLNIAFIYSKIGKENESKQTHQKVLDEFPKSFDAQIALDTINIMKSDTQSNYPDNIQIPFSKKKIIIYILLAGIFILISSFILINKNITVYEKYVFILCLVMCSVIELALISRLFDKRPGLIINRKGIIDNSTFTSLGFINWKSIKAIYYSKSFNQKVIHIELINTEEILKNQIIFIQLLARLNKQKFKTGIDLSSKLLNCSLSDLNRVLQNEYKRNKNA